MACYYNGIKMPDLPEVDEDRLPYQLILYCEETNRAQFYAFDKRPEYYYDTIFTDRIGRSWGVGVYADRRVYFGTALWDGEGSEFTDYRSGDNVYYDVTNRWWSLENNYQCGGVTVVGWSNFDIRATNGTLYMAASTPVPIAGTAEKPTFTKNLEELYVYALGTAAPPLVVEATVSDGGTLTYQWYKINDDGDIITIEGATTRTYTPSTSQEGATGYFCVAKNTLPGGATAQCTSNTANVGVSLDGSWDDGSGGGITPEGTLEITDNGVYDVTYYETASVSVPAAPEKMQKSFMAGMATAIGLYGRYASIGGGTGGSSGSSGTVAIRNQNKTITANGTYTHDPGFTGLGVVTVNVVGGSLPKCKLLDLDVQKSTASVV